MSLSDGEYNGNEIDELSEADAIRKDRVAAIMDDVFTDDVIESWDSPDMTDEAKTELLNQYYQRAGEELGINASKVYVEDLQSEYGEGTMGYNDGDGSVHVDASLLDGSEQLPTLLDTVTHETRHQMQNEAIQNPEAFPDIPQDTLDRWKYEWDNYIDPDYDLEGYYNQEIERDARGFGEGVVDRFMDRKQNKNETQDEGQDQSAEQSCEGSGESNDDDYFYGYGM